MVWLVAVGKGSRHIEWLASFDRNIIRCFQYRSAHRILNGHNGVCQGQIVLPPILPNDHFPDFRALAEMFDHPTPFLGNLAQAPVGVDGDGVTKQIEQRHVRAVIGVTVGAG